MSKFEGVAWKFIVFNWKDIDRYLDEVDFEALDSIAAKINIGRIQEGKKLNSYITVNADEPYADKVIDIMKEYGDWGRV
jgi:hypothetical protein